MSIKECLAEDVVGFINNNDRVFFGGFTHAGCPKVVPLALAKKAREIHFSGGEFKIHVLASASTGDEVDGELTRSNAVISKMPYQGCSEMRKAINENRISYFDMHVSRVAMQFRNKFLDGIDCAIIEAADVTNDGEIVLTTGIGIVPNILNLAKKIIIEVNEYHPASVRCFHDFYEPELPPFTKPISILTPHDRIGSDIVKVDPSKIVAIVRVNKKDNLNFTLPHDDTNEKIGHNVADFLANEIKVGRIPKTFLPIQSGVGNISNAVLNIVSKHPAIPKYEMFSEILQDSVIEGLKNDDVKFASAAGLGISAHILDEIYSDLGFFKHKIILRTQEISNHPEVIVRLGVISMNAALEVDIFGNVNSTHVCGTHIMNGIGGAADYSRNAYLSILMCKSIARDGKISAIVPLCSHIDHTEHSVSIVATEWGVADLRGKDPRQRAQEIIEKCAHPMYRENLRKFLSLSPIGHEPLKLEHCFDMYRAFNESGDMMNVKF